MLKKLLAGAIVVTAVLALAVPAHAKGEGGNITIKPSGGGSGGVPGGGTTLGGGKGGGGGSSALLASPIHLRGERSAFWFEATGFGQYKNDAPVTYGGTIPPSKLGPAFDVTASFLCGPGHRGTIHQVLYPYAKGGPQTYTPANQFMCGMELGQGYWAGDQAMFDALVSKGLPPHAPAAAPVTNAAADAAVQHDDRSAWPLVLAGGLALALLLVSGAVAQQRRARKVRVPA